jgi:leucyl aminopeptidase
VPTFEVSTASPQQVAADVLVVPFYEGRTPGPGFDAVGKALGVDLRAILADHQASGRLGDEVTLATMGKLKARHVLLVGVGPEDEADAGAIRRAVQRVAGSIAPFGTLATTLGQVGDSPEDSAHALAEGLVLGTYRFDRYKERPLDEESKLEMRLKKVVVLTSTRGGSAVKAALRRGQVYAEAANWARDLVNTPALDATPDFLAREAKAMAAKHGLTCKIWTKPMLQRGGFGGILGVGSGSANEPRLIELTYRGAGNARPLAITGKGITFDSGGLSIKPADGMETMKDDMGGAAAALAAMRAVGQLKPKINVIAAIPTAENMPGGSAIRPGDVLRHYGGKTSEVLNTDAEGRLVLADALAYLTEKNPFAVIDTATLTGAAMIALGSDLWAVIGSDDRLMADLLDAGREEGEPGWQLPLWTDYRRKIESSVADVKNVGDRWGGAITAALFLKEFAGDAPWVHLDIAGTARVASDGPYTRKGGTGFGVRTLVELLTRYERPAPRESAKEAAAKAATEAVLPAVTEEPAVEVVEGAQATTATAPEGGSKS